MDQKLFQDLKKSIKEAGEIIHGEKPASRRFDYPKVDVKAARTLTGLSQPDFASFLGVGLGTLRHWEQGDYAPSGAARTLLYILANEPRASLRALRAVIRDKRQPAPIR